MIIQMEQLRNLRDLGGIAGKDGRKVRKELLFRSEELQRGTPADLQRLAEQHRLKVIIDLRCAAERSDSPNPAVTGATEYWFPILKEETLGITHREAGSSTEDFFALLRNPKFSAEQYMASLYTAIAEDSQAHEQYRLFLELLAQGHGPALWHCTAGKDRAGIATALVLMALGASRQAITEDYLLTNTCTYQKTVQAAEHYLPGEPKLQKAFCVVMQVQESYLQAFFNAVDAAGGNEAYLTGTLGVGEQTIQKLQEIYLEEEQ